MEANALIRRAESDYAMLINRCGAFDVEIMINLRRRGGESLARVGGLAFRQCLAAHKLVADANGQTLMFPKENFSNGCIGTVDVIYPSSPLFLLKEKGLDPENQLCTDDFAGHLARNANLSLKAIIALGAYAQLADAAGRRNESAAYRSAAQEMVKAWMTQADDGDHYRLAFDKPGTWSQKYNLVWDRVLGLNLFPPEVIAKEFAFYKTKLNRYGLPLDSRKDYTKADWLVWTATLGDKPRELAPFIQPLDEFLHESPSRVPFTDWYDTKTGKMEGFQARSVVGGVFMPMLTDANLWKKWSSRAK